MDKENPLKDLEGLLARMGETFQVGIDTLGQWSEQARAAVQDSPGVMITGLALAGFMSGILLRRGTAGLRRARATLGVDPLAVLAIGAVAGAAFGPAILGEREPLRETRLRPVH